MRQEPRGMQPTSLWPSHTHTHTDTHSHRHTHLWLTSSTGVDLLGGLNPKIISGHKDNQKLNANNKTFDSMCRTHDKSLEYNGADLLNITDYILVYSAPCKKWHMCL